MLRQSNDKLSEPERALFGQIPNWVAIPLPDDGAQLVEWSGRRIPERFGGWWREVTETAELAEQRPTGREVVLRISVVDGRLVLDEVTFRGFQDEFDRQGVPAMRDGIAQMFMVFDGEVPASIASAMRGAGTAERTEILKEVRRRRRRNSIDVERVAELYRSGGPAAVADEFGVSRATAYRWKKRAVEAGALGEDD